MQKGKSTPLVDASQRRFQALASEDAEKGMKLPRYSLTPLRQEKGEERGRGRDSSNALSPYRCQLVQREGGGWSVDNGRTLIAAFPPEIRTVSAKMSRKKADKCSPDKRQLTNQIGADGPWRALITCILKIHDDMLDVHD